MDAPHAAIATASDADLWAACEERSVIRLTLADGQMLTGSYTSRAGMHFLHRTGRDLPLIGEVILGAVQHSDQGLIQHDDACGRLGTGGLGVGCA